MDYECERGAKRNFEVWRNKDGEEGGRKLETEEEMLERLEAEEAERGGAMEALEGKVADARQEMAIADALDEIRTRNARILRAEGKGDEGVVDAAEKVRREREVERERVEREDEEAARRAFGREIEIEDEEGEGLVNGGDSGDGVGQMKGNGEGTKAKGATVGGMPPPEFKRVVKKKKDFSAALGIKKKPALV